MSVNAPHPFDGYKMYGPRIHQGRRVVFLVGDNDRTTLSYAKYLMSIHLGRKLSRKEIVDHINNDVLDDRVENYQIMDHPTHMQKHATGLKMRTFVCESCGEEFTRRDDGNYRSYCSRKCMGAAFQHSMTKEQYEKLFGQ